MLSSKFHTVEDLCNFLGGDKPIKRLLVANNGLAAAKGIQSIRNWLHDHLNNTDAIQLVVMASPEDLKANSEFIRLSNQHVQVPGGSNVNNYANVHLIVNSAIRTRCDAIYPGWGHASENPELPRECSKTNTVIFLGPPEQSIFALGDKIASTMIAQSNGVPTAPWNGEAIRLKPGVFYIPESTFAQAHITSAEECLKVCNRLGYPIMIKASGGGGGKGIRQAFRSEDVLIAYGAAIKEVENSPIFCMKMLNNIRHLEVQLLADNFGNCIAVRTRDCSVQRRHQKIIEEGPVVNVAPDTIIEMETAAIRLAKVVGYVGLGTVEFMYDKDSMKFYFLELNPRIQVEHPVSELITGVNLPAALLCVGMGIPLHRIPEIRSLYGKNPYDSSPIDFVNSPQRSSMMHAIAVRITSEDPEEGFRPTTGKIDEIVFNNSKDCWGYFSVPPSGGAIHEFADSQFGHIFATGPTRERARLKMVFALRNTIIRGEIRTSHSYIVELLERQEFRECDVNTSWLDKLIAQHPKERSSQDFFPALVAGAIHQMRKFITQCMNDYKASLRAGHTPSIDLLCNHRTVVFVCQRERFVVEISRSSPCEYALTLNGSSLVVPCRECGMGLQMSLDGHAVVAYCEEEPASLRVTINGKSSTFTGDIDPTKLKSAVPGRLVRFLVGDGKHVEANTAYAEVEVMKMILPLLCPIEGTISIKVSSGITVTVGKLLAEVEPDDPSCIARPNEFSGVWPVSFSNDPNASELSPVSSTHDLNFVVVDCLSRLCSTIDIFWYLMQGYMGHDASLQCILLNATEDLTSIVSPNISLKKLVSNLPYLGPYGTQLGNTATDKGLAIINCLADSFLKVETVFDKVTREEGIESLKAQYEKDLDQIYAIDFAHVKKHRHQVLCAIINGLEKKRRLLLLCKPALEGIAHLQATTAYGPLLLQARYLLRQCSLPSFDERKTEFCQALENGDSAHLMKGTYGYDLIFDVLFDVQKRGLIYEALILLLNRSYFDVGTIDSIDTWLHHGCWFVHYKFKMSSEEYSDAQSPPEYPYEGHGFVALVDEQESLLKEMQNILKPAQQLKGPVVFTCLFAVKPGTTQQEVAALCEEVVKEVKVELVDSGVEVITFMVHTSTSEPQLFTFKKNTDYMEDKLCRNVMSTTAHRLELSRLSNYSVEMFPTPYSQVHVFSAKPIKPKSSAVETRLFVRMFVSSRELGVSPYSLMKREDASHVLAMCLSAIEFARSDKQLSTTVYNHLFINFIELSFDVAILLEVFKRLEERFAKRLYELGFREAEIRFKVNTDAGPMAFRITIVNSTGLASSFKNYVEVKEGNHIVLHRAEYRDDLLEMSSIWESRDHLLNDSDDYRGVCSNNGGSPVSTLETDSVGVKMSAVRALLPARDPSSRFDRKGAQDVIILGPYPLMSECQIHRLSAQVTGTTYVHDWVGLFECAVRREWKAFRREWNLPRSVLPLYALQATEMTIHKETGSLIRGIMDKSVGMLVWEVGWFPASYYDIENHHHQARKMILIANDITNNAGSFAVPEDAVFKAASIYARMHGLPFVYISSNSGARLGLCNEIKKCLKVMLNAQEDSYEYLYLIEEDYTRLTGQGIAVNCEEMTMPDGKEKRFKLIDVIGSQKDYLGAENLRGSALIAGEMSLNYTTIPTISIVSGRTVGIGAYLVRLGRRVVQAGGAPIILTGYAALNRLLGKDIYSNNNQLGGPSIMGPNGVSHWCCSDDLEAAGIVLKWLASVPAVTNKSFIRRSLTQAVWDPIDRDVTFIPHKAEAYDPRHLVTGLGNLTGMFDKDSWSEALEQWARSVVVGRASLGGIPCGVILVETRTTKKFNPADAADPESSSSINAQAGQVWFPDSARKTADSLEDFAKESLPCFIIANWRGFSGGMRDMFDQVLKFGASIVDNLRTYRAPVFIYLPPFGELRGGAWVVVDPVINHYSCVEMYCAPMSRGGILEPNGVVEIKFREGEIREMIRSNDKELIALLQQGGKAEALKRENQLLSVYRDASIHFADLHDTPGCMKAKCCVLGVVPWVNVRREFYKKLVRKMHELDRARVLVEAGFGNTEAALSFLKGQFKSLTEKEAGDDEEGFTAFLISKECRSVIESAISQCKQQDLMRMLMDKEVLMKVLETYPEVRETFSALVEKLK